MQHTDRNLPRSASELSASHGETRASAPPRSEGSRASSFEAAHDFVAQWEGGLVNHPNDPGGITNHGVSLRWLKAEGVDINNDGDVNAEDIRALTKTQAKRLFKTKFWDALTCDTLARPIAIALYDAAINQGQARAVAQLQAGCNAVLAKSDFWYTLKEDGIIGPKTRQALADLTDLGQDKTVAQAMITCRETFYRELTRKRPELVCFLKGWLNRTHALSNYI